MADCERWREAISAWLDGAGTPQENEEVQAHLQQCPACRQWREQVEADRQVFVSSLMGRQADISDSVMRRVREMSVEPQEAVTREKRSSFRLAELLVVVVITLVMAAILFPVFATSREKAKQSSCMSNVRQVCNAIMGYAMDYDERLPLSENWSETVRPYMKNAAILLCPTDKTGEKLSYALVSRWSGVRLGDIPDLANTIIVYEAEHGQAIYRHNGGMNVGYADGHAKWIKKLPEGLAAVTAVNPGAPDNNYGLRRDLKLAYDASCEVWVGHLQEAVVTAEQAFYDRGGFVLTSTLSQPTGQGAGRAAQVTGKVPTAEVGNTINALAALGYVARREIQGQDMTDAYVAQARQVTQTDQTLGQVEHQRAAARPATKPALETRKRDVLEQLGVAQDTLSGTERKLALATITASLIERAPEVSASVGGLARAWQSFTHTAAHLGVALVWLGLYGLLVAPFVVGVLVYRKRRRQQG